MKNLLSGWAATLASTFLPIAGTRGFDRRAPALSEALCPESTLPSLPPAMAGSGARRNYGCNDPVLDAHRFVWRCPCGARPVVDFSGLAARLASELDEFEPPQEDGASRLPIPATFHFVRCEACKRMGRPSAMPWVAITEWNRAHPDTSIAMGEFPFFELGGLSLREARSKLLSVRADLETRRARAKTLAREGHRVSRRYCERIDAHLRWTIVAQALALAHMRGRRTAGPNDAADSHWATRTDLRGSDRP